MTGAVSVCNRASASATALFSLRIGMGTVLAFSSEVQSHVMEGHVEIEHVICHGSSEVQDVICQQQSGDLEHMMEIEAFLADWLGEGSAEAQGSAEAHGS